MGAFWNLPLRRGARFAGWQRRLAFSAHAYTIAGGILAIAALREAAARQFDRAFLFLALALFVDATDGMLARRLAVNAEWPTIDGERLDALVDFVSFAVVPSFIASVSGILPEPVFAWSAFMVIASLLRFSLRRTKKAGRFTCLPSSWNLIVFYSFSLHLLPIVVAACVVLAAVLMFVPARYPHPTMHPSRHLHLAIAMPAATAAIGVLAGFLQPRPWLYISMAYPAFYLAHAAWLTLVISRGGREMASKIRRLISAIIGNYPRLGYAS